MEASQFFLQLAVILVSARFAAEVAARFGAPSVMGELIAGIVLPNSGYITAGETRITDLDERARRESRICRIGMVFQVCQTDS